MTAVFYLAALVLAAGPSDAVLYEFSSQRCSHCQAMQPIVAQLASQGMQVQVIDVDQQPEAAQQLRVTGVPTFVALSGGQETGRIVGATSAEKLAALVHDPKAATSGRGPAVSSGDSSPERSAQAATVRIKVEDATGFGFGTGTVIDAHDGEALVVTCGRGIL